MPLRENVVRIISHWIRLSTPASIATHFFSGRYFTPFHRRRRHNIQLVTKLSRKFHLLCLVMCLQGDQVCDKFKFLSIIVCCWRNFKLFRKFKYFFVVQQLMLSYFFREHEFSFELQIVTYYTMCTWKSYFIAAINIQTTKP